MPAGKIEYKDQEFILLVNPNIEPKVQFFNRFWDVPYKRGVTGWVGLSDPKAKEYIDPEKSEDRGFRIYFYWHSASRTWEIVGRRLPEMYIAKNQEHADKYYQTDTVFDTQLSKGQGDVILQFVQWIEELTKDTPVEEVCQTPEDRRNQMFSS